MPAAGSAEVAFAVEDSFRTLPGTPVWRQPGENIEVGELSFENQLERKQQPAQSTPDGSRRGNYVGSFSITFELTDTNWYELVFPTGSGLGPDSNGEAPTATWYVPQDLGPTDQERYLEGTGVTSFAVNYEQGSAVTVDLTMTYTFEPDPAGMTTPSNIDKPTKDDIVNSGGFDLDINGAVVEEPQSATIEVGNMIVTRRDQTPFFSGMDIGQREPSLTVTTILNDERYRGWAYGSSSAAEPLSEVDATTATATFDNKAGTLSTWTLDTVQFDSEGWQDHVSGDTQTTDDFTAHVANITTA